MTSGQNEKHHEVIDLEEEGEDGRSLDNLVWERFERGELDEEELELLFDGKIPESLLKDVPGKPAVGSTEAERQSKGSLLADGNPVIPLEETEEIPPDLHTLFQYYDDVHFESKLKCVEVKWSRRMTLCAGVCVYHVSW